MSDNILEYDENKEYEDCITKAPATVTKESFVKLPTRLMRNKFYQKWRGTQRASTAEFLMGFVIRKKYGNSIADKIYEEYYCKRQLLVARFTQQGLADRLGYKDCRGVNNHMTKLEKEGIFKVHDNRWNGRKLKIYEFGYWDDVTGNDYFEVIYMYKKFNEMLMQEEAT